MDEFLISRYPELESRHFWWVSRREMVKALLGPSIAGSRILDVGCGSGQLARELTNSGARVVGVDMSSHPEWSTSNGSNPRFLEHDYLEVASGLGEFDRVLCLDVIEHIEDESAFVQTVRGNVAPGGRVIITVPAYPWLWSRHDEMNHHFRRYRRKDLRDALAAGGLDVLRCGYAFFNLIVPKLIARAIEGVNQKPLSGQPPPDVLNRAALSYFRWEHRLALRRSNFLPAGTSVVAVCRHSE